VIEGSSQHLSLLHNADQTRKTAPAQAQTRRGSAALVGCWLPASLLPLAPLLSETTAAQTQGPLAAVWLHERFDLHHARLVAWTGHSLANRLCAGVSILRLLLLLLLLFLLGHDKTRGDVRLQLDINGYKALLVSLSGLGCGCGGKCNACHVMYLFGAIFYAGSSSSRRTRRIDGGSFRCFAFRRAWPWLACRGECHDDMAISHAAMFTRCYVMFTHWGSYG
jgi:hypothetical protein